MEMEASRALPADRDTVWRALDDPEVPGRGIPGRGSPERGEDTPFEPPKVRPLDQPPRPDDVGLWTGVAALALVLIASVWLR